MRGKKRGKARFRTVPLPEDLYVEVERVVREGGYGFRSVAEFVRAAVREYLRKYKK